MMKLKFALGILITMLLMLGSRMTSPATAQTPKGEDGLKLLSSGSQEIVLELTVPDFEVETIDHQGQTYQRFVIPKAAQTSTPGDPQVPVRGVFLGLPSTEGVSVAVVEADYETLSGYRLYPAPAIRLVGDDIVEPSDIERVEEVFSLNQDRYAANAFYPGGLAEIGETGALRDQTVASVRFYPVQYNPASGEVRLYRRIVARVTWSTPSLQAAGQTRRASPTYEKVLRNTLLNYDSLDRSAAMRAAPLLDADAISAASGTSTKALKVGVTEDGLYRLNPGDLSGNDFSLSGVSLSNIKMENRGVEIPIYAHDDNSNDAFDGNDYILFYGTAITDIYTTKNIYWLEEGSGPGARMSSRSGTLGGASVPPHFPVALHAEEDTFYWPSMVGGGNQDHWFWKDKISPATSGLSTYHDYSLALGTVSTEPGASTATVRVRLKGRTELNHRTKIYLNGIQIDDQSWSGPSIFDHEVTVSHSLLQNGTNTVRVEAADSGDALPHQMYVNWIEIDYWRTYVAENDELLFGAPSAGAHKFSVTGFSSSDIQVFDVTSPTNVAILTDTTTGSDSVQFEDTAGTDTRYLALTTAKSPASIELDEPSNLKGSIDGHYIIITHEDFYSSAQTLAAHRASVGVTAGEPVATVKVEDIYDEFNYGIFNPQAIHDFISYADSSWGGDPAYILLLGGASYDYRDILGLSRDNFVPTQIIETDLLGQTPSDNWFVTDDTLPYMFIARLTPQNSAEAADMVDKIIYYEQGAPWSTDMLLVADDDDPVFETNSELIADALPDYYTVDRVYAGDYSSGNPTSDIKNIIDGGELLVNYNGHGNVDTWGTWDGGRIYKRSNIPSLNNTNKLPVITVGNCLNGYFVGRATSMSEEFLKRDNKGAVAVWAATSLGYPSGHRVLLGEFYDVVFQEDKYDLGKVTWQAKINTYAQSSSWAELVETFVLFGDPAMQLGLPTNYPYLESTTPANGTVDVPLDQAIEIEFSKSMNPATVSLSGDTAGLDLGNPIWLNDNKTVRYTHLANFNHSQTLSFSIDGQDTAGLPLGVDSVPTTWSFSTPTAPAAAPISGPETGVVQVDYTFNANVSPITTTLPLTYVWEATGQDPATHTGSNNLTDTSPPFNWDTIGTKTITVTVSNAIDSVTDTHEVIVGYSRPTSLNVSGRTEGAINTPYSFDAAVGPITSTRPITYVWQTAGQPPVVSYTGSELNHTATFSWTTVGLQAITVTVTNAGGTITKTYFINISQVAVFIAGPQSGTTNTAYTFDATFEPDTAAQPVTYVWEATGQSPEEKVVTHADGGLNDTESFTWSEPGPQVITVTATNVEGVAVATHSVTIEPAQSSEDKSIFLPIVIK